MSPLRNTNRFRGIQGEIFRTVDEVVRSKKELIRETFPRLSRFMTGYNLAGVLDENDSIFNLNPLLSGSEGTLAFVSEARLKLTPIPKERFTAGRSLRKFQGCPARRIEVGWIKSNRDRNPR